MSVTREATITRFRGDSSDAKPGLDSEPTIQVNSTFTERDTGDRYLWNGAVWVRQVQTIETMFLGLMEINAEMLGEMKTLRAATATIANG